MYLTTIIVLTLLNVPVQKYSPVIDSVGRSGTFDESRAERISDDIILCQELAKTNTTFFWKYQPLDS